MQLYTHRRRKQAREREARTTVFGTTELHAPHHSIAGTQASMTSSSSLSSTVGMGGASGGGIGIGGGHSGTSGGATSGGNVYGVAPKFANEPPDSGGLCKTKTTQRLPNWVNDRFFLVSDDRVPEEVSFGNTHYDQRYAPTNI